MTPDIQFLLNYQNKKILTRFEKNYPDSRMQAEEAWQELMKFIWLCQQHRLEQNKFPANLSLQFACVMHEEMKDIDNMWHTFLLFTRDYHAFCFDYLGGEFFHHDPLVDVKEISQSEYEVELGRYLSYIYDKLGEVTLLKWFA